MRISFGRSGSNLSAASWSAVAASLGGLPPRGDGVLDVKADVQPIEGVDGAEEQRDLDLLLLAEMRLESLVSLVGRAGLVDLGQGLGPGERGAFARVEERRFTPGGEHDHALRGFAVLERVAHVKIEALAAAVD